MKVLRQVNCSDNRSPYIYIEHTLIEHTPVSKYSNKRIIFQVWINITEVLLYSQNIICSLLIVTSVLPYCIADVVGTVQQCHAMVPGHNHVWMDHFFGLPMKYFHACNIKLDTAIHTHTSIVYTANLCISCTGVGLAAGCCNNNTKKKQISFCKVFTHKFQKKCGVFMCLLIPVYMANNTFSGFIPVMPIPSN